MDRRIRRTRTLIFDAALELSMEKPLEKISVVELCDKAGINKSTFYLHYKCIDDCFQKCHEYIMQEIMELSNKLDYQTIFIAPRPAVSAILDDVEKHRRYLKKFKRSIVCDKLVQSVKDAFIKEICEKNAVNAAEDYQKVVRISFMVGGFVEAILRHFPDYHRQDLEEALVEILKR